jgi:hypothetical protein
LNRRDTPFDDQVNIDTGADGQGRIRLPLAMLPVIQGARFKLGSIGTTDSESTGTAQVNFMNKSRLRLD